MPPPGSELSWNVAKNEIAGKVRAGRAIADWIESRAVIATVVVAGGGEIGDPVGLDLVDRQSDDAVGEERLLRVADVIVNHVGFALALGVSELQDVGGKLHLTREGGGEAELRVRRDVVNDLQKRPAFISP